MEVRKANYKQETELLSGIRVPYQTSNPEFTSY